MPAGRLAGWIAGADTCIGLTGSAFPTCRERVYFSCTKILGSVFLRIGCLCVVIGSRNDPVPNFLRLPPLSANSPQLVWCGPPSHRYFGQWPIWSEKNLKFHFQSNFFPKLSSKYLDISRSTVISSEGPITFFLQLFNIWAAPRIDTRRSQLTLMQGKLANGHFVML